MQGFVRLYNEKFGYKNRPCMVVWSYFPPQTSSSYGLFVEWPCDLPMSPGAM